MDLKIETQTGKIGVAVSGGIDSMSLLHAYCLAGQDVLVINVEHGIRGESSLRDTDFVRNYCLLNNIPFASFSVNTPKSLRAGESMETCARRLRYEVFDKLLSEGTVSKIALAHHADDNAETVLMRIFRGTGIRGLIGIGDRGNYIRPFIRYSRTQIEEYAKEHSIPFVTDETNLSDEYTRNFIRNDLLPMIKLKYPDVVRTITRLSESACETDEYLVSVSPKATVKDDGRHIKNLFGYPIILQKYAIMQVVKDMGFLQDFEMRHIDSVCALASSPNNTTIDLPFGLIATRYNDGVIISEKLCGNFSPTPYDEQAVYSYCGKSYRFERGTKIIPGRTMDANKIPAGSVIRLRKYGDVFKHVNGKTKLLSDYLNEKKLSKPEKDSLLVLASGKEIIAVLGLETADSVKVTENTSKILHIIRE